MELQGMGDGWEDRVEQAEETREDRVEQAEGMRAKFLLSAHHPQRHHHAQ